MDRRLPAAPRRAFLTGRGGRLVGPSAASRITRATAVTLVGLLLSAGAGEVHERRQQADLAAAAADARLDDLAQRNRTTRADSARLTGAAVQYAAMRREEALSAARAAVQAAEAVVVSASATPDVPAETVTPLGQATAELVALLDATPEVPARSGSGAASSTPRPPADPPSTDPASTDPATDVATTDPAGVDRPTARGLATDPVTAGGPTGRPAEGQAAGLAAARAGRTSPPTADETPADDAGTTPADRIAPSDGDADAPATDPDVPAEDRTEAVETLRALDLTVSAEVLAAARRVTDLSHQTQAAADAAVAEAAAARAAQAAAQAAVDEAARAAAAALTDRIAAADAAPNGQIPPEVLCGLEIAPDALLRCDAARALDRLAEAYRADVGRDLVVVSTYRSFETQVAVKAAKGDLAAEPGRSNHGRGLAVDLGGFGGVGDFTAPAYLWMKEHAEAFGWHHPAAMEPGGPGPQEPWHWEFDTED